MSKKILLSGMQPTQQLHLGNYLGALKNWVKLQKEYECLFIAVDSHSITVKIDPESLRTNTYSVIATYLAGGIDPTQATLFVQSHVPEHAELAWVLTCHATMGELNRMTQFKDKSEMAGKNIPVGLFTYPVLMAADILLYQTNLVPVGEDQKQHLELTRDLAERMNKRYGKKLFTLPDPYIQKLGGRVMDLQAPEKKMSKSAENPKGVIFLNDPESEIMKKVKSAVTDSGSEIIYEDSKPGVQNLLDIQSALTGKKIEELVKSYVGKQYGHLKIETGEIIHAALKPIREETSKLLKDRPYLDSVLRKGAEKARQKASETLKKTYESIGFLSS